jgi:uncharacterized membrane protein YagU involved in acid resistance
MSFSTKQDSMKQNKWLVISFIGMFVFFAINAGIDCSSEIRAWRGNKAGYLALFMAFTFLVPFFTFAAQVLNLPTTWSKIVGFLFFLALLFVEPVTLVHLARMYCH